MMPGPAKKNRRSCCLREVSGRFFVITLLSLSCLFLCHRVLLVHKVQSSASHGPQWQSEVDWPGVLGD